MITGGALTLAESGAILEYLVEREGSRLPPAPGTPQRAGYSDWMHYVEAARTRVGLPSLPKIEKWLQRIQTRPSLATCRSGQVDSECPVSPIDRPADPATPLRRLWVFHAVRTGVHLLRNIEIRALARCSPMQFSSSSFIPAVGCVVESGGRTSSPPACKRARHDL